MICMTRRVTNIFLLIEINMALWWYVQNCIILQKILSESLSNWTSDISFLLRGILNNAGLSEVENIEHSTW